MTRPSYPDLLPVSVEIIAANADAEQGSRGDDGLHAQGPPTAVVIQNTKGGGPGQVGAWLREVGIGLEVLRPFESDVLPKALGGRPLLVLGGGFLPNDDERAPWLPAIRPGGARVRMRADRYWPAGFVYMMRSGCHQNGTTLGIDRRGDTVIVTDHAGISVGQVSFLDFPAEPAVSPGHLCPRSS